MPSRDGFGGRGLRDSGDCESTLADPGGDQVLIPRVSPLDFRLTEPLLRRRDPRVRSRRAAVSLPQDMAPGLSTAGSASASPWSVGFETSTAYGEDLSADGEAGSQDNDPVCPSRRTAGLPPNIGVSGAVFRRGAHGFRKGFQTLQDGNLSGPHLDADAELGLITHAEGYAADTRLVWNPGGVKPFLSAIRFVAR